MSACFYSTKRGKRCKNALTPSTSESDNDDEMLTAPGYQYAELREALPRRCLSYKSLLVLVRLTLSTAPNQHCCAIRLDYARATLELVTLLRHFWAEADKPLREMMLADVMLAISCCDGRVLL